MPAAGRHVYERFATLLCSQAFTSVQRGDVEQPGPRVTRAAVGGELVGELQVSDVQDGGQHSVHRVHLVSAEAEQPEGRLQLAEPLHVGLRERQRGREREDVVFILSRGVSGTEVLS